MKFTSPTDYFYKINLVFSWILAAPLVIFVLLFLEWRDTEWKAWIDSELTREYILYIGLPVLLAIVVAAIRRFYLRRLEMMEQVNLQIKLSHYAKAFTRLQLILSFCGLLAMMGIFLTGHNLFAAYYFVLLFYISLTRPSPEVISKHLRLKKEEREILVKKKPFQSEN